MTPEEELKQLKEKINQAKQLQKEKNRQYKQDNKERITEYKKERYASLTQEEKDAFQKAEYQRRKEKMLETKKQVINCPVCNKEIKQGSLYSHKKSQHPV